jgi:hypothetical protein
MTKKIKSVIYGLGGYDESMPDNNIVSYEYYSDEEMAELAEAEAKATAKAAILDRLGLTADEAAILLG